MKKEEDHNKKKQIGNTGGSKIKRMVFLIVLSCAACLPAKIISQASLDAMDGDVAPRINVSEATRMVFSSKDPNYVSVNADDKNYVRGFICDNNTYPRAYWKVGDSAEVNGPNDPNITPLLKGDGSLVLVFVLPVKLVGEVVAEADLVSYVGWITAIEPVDLYGIRTVAAGTPLDSIVKKSDYYVGLFGCDPCATPIQTEYIQMPYSGSRNQWHITGYWPEDMNGSDRLRCWLQDQYDNHGAVGGDYVLLRLNVGGYRPIVPPAIVAGLDSYHQVQVSSMWDNLAFVADDFNDLNSIPLTQLTKASPPSHSPRLFIRLATGSAPACPEPVAYCCADFPGDLTGNCRVDVNDLSIMVDSWLDSIVDVNDTKLLSRHTFDGGGTAKWDNSVAGGFKVIPFDSNDPNKGGTVIYDEERGRVADIHSSTSWLYVGPDPLLDTNHITTQLTITTWVNSTNTSAHWIAGKGYSWYLSVDSGLHFTVRDANDSDTNYPPITLDGNKVVSDSKWHHVAATYDAISGALKLYTDGVPEANIIHYHGPTGYIHQYDALGSPYTIGSRIKCDPNDANIPAYIREVKSILHGYVDDVRIYGRVLSAEDIKSLASAGLPADATHDNKVNFIDFAALAEDWLKCAWFSDPECSF